jgi:uncharacterized protein
MSSVDIASSGPSAPATGEAASRLPSIDRTASIFAGLALLGGTVLIGNEVSAKMAVLFLIGSGLGFALLHGAFGFTAGWRQLVTRSDGRGMRAQFLVVGLTMLAFIPLINGYAPDGLSPAGAIAPVGTSLIVGAFLFGLGMQLGNGCGSGTLFALGGGSKRMVITLAFFIVGSVIGSIHLPWWLDQPGFDPVNLATVFTIPGAIVLQAAALAALAWWTLRRERKAGLTFTREPHPRTTLARLMRGPWPYLAAGLAIVGLNIATLLIAGHPWTITYGFALWGAKAAQAVGFDMSQFEFWQWPKGADALSNSLLADVTSVMNLGLVLGAMLAAALAGSFAKPNRLSGRSIAGAIVGGLLMGYGARLAFGCNIGAFLGGIGSGSLHGWIWFALAFAGTLVGIRLRPFFGLSRD